MLLSCCVLWSSRDAWPEDPERVAEIEGDFLAGRPDVGDRRQELVFIGIEVRGRRGGATFTRQAPRSRHMQSWQASPARLPSTPAALLMYSAAVSQM
jgi:hypothetical protein